MAIDDTILNNANNPPVGLPPELKGLIDKVLGYASSPIAGARGMTAHQGSALTGVANIAGGVYGHQLGSQEAGMSNLLSMRGQDIQEKDAANTLDWAKKSNPLIYGDEASKIANANANAGGKGVGTSNNSSSSKLDWGGSLGENHLDYLKKYGLNLGG
ncbi:MAG: hypothetical protein LLG40_13365 [Deltaproteobacteria bacterium]|nr:hypothetical protein [Deltaproteobacteria bacterium]